MKKARIAASLVFTGAGDRNRTCDLRVTSALLYRLSYTGAASDYRGLSGRTQAWPDSPITRFTALGSVRIGFAACRCAQSRF